MEHITKKLLVGSSRFFDKTEHDRDYFCLRPYPRLIETTSESGEVIKVLEYAAVNNGSRMTDEDGNCCFIYDFSNKTELYAWHLSKNTDPMNFGHLIIPKVIEHFGISITDTEWIKAYKLQHNLQKPTHQYTDYIATCYVENGSFTLSEEQLSEAFHVYSRSRKIAPIKNALIRERKEILTFLAETDYIVIKIQEAKLLGENTDHLVLRYEQVLAERNTKRERQNEIERLLEQV